MADLNFFGFIDSVFKSIDATRISKSGGGYVSGIWTPGSLTMTNHQVTLQPLNDKEIQQLKLGGERLGDVRKIYVNDGVIYNISESDDWTFQANEGVDGTFKTIALDNRPWRNYCKVIVSRYDN